MRKIKQIAAWMLILIAAAVMLAGCGGKKAQETQAPAQTSAVVQTEGIESTESAAEAESIAAETENITAETESIAAETESAGLSVTEDGTYTSKEEVALYIHTYGKLPSNYVTKKEAQAAGWNNKKGNLQKVIPGASIGGDRYGNYEGLLPDKKGRKYFECDIDYDGGYRDAKRIVYSNDGLIFYTEDHYKSFETLYE